MTERDKGDKRKSCNRHRLLFTNIGIGYASYSVTCQVNRSEVNNLIEDYCVRIITVNEEIPFYFIFLFSYSYFYILFVFTYCL